MEEEEVFEPIVLPYDRFKRANGVPYAFVELTLEEYYETDVPDDAKWALKNIVCDDNGDVVSCEVRSFPEFAPHARIDVANDRVILLLCACSRPTIRQRAVTYDDLEQWDMWLAFTFGIQLDEWMTKEEADALYPVEDITLPSITVE